MIKPIHYLSVIAVLISFIACGQQTKETIVPQTLTPEQDSLVARTMRKAQTVAVFSQERQAILDSAILQDQTIAYLWQQKAMPLFKQRKYQLGMKYVDKAVEYDRFRWQEYRAFIKCIFAKTYQESIDDFENCKLIFGNRIVMDHSYNFYIALCKLQLNEYAQAEKLLDEDIANDKSKRGEDWIHYLDLFYAGIAKYELRKYEEAISYFDRCLIKYPNFAEGEYYKSACLRRQNKIELANSLFELSVKHGKNGNSITEDNVIYETYPYAINWEKWMR